MIMLPLLLKLYLHLILLPGLHAVYSVYIEDEDENAKMNDLACCSSWNSRRDRSSEDENVKMLKKTEVMHRLQNDQDYVI